MALEIRDIELVDGDHAVEFYERDADLAHTVGRYLSEAIRDGGVAIAIATGPHRRAFEDELRAAGIDVVTARRDGDLVSLDAAATVATLMPDGRVDRDAFRRVVGPVVARAAETGRPVRAYGEMVALLWEAGDVLAAIDLERLWNDLRRELHFTLLCAYRSQSVQGDARADALRQVCDLHSRVAHPPLSEERDALRSAPSEVSAHFAAERDAPRHARHLGAQALRRWGYGSSLVDDAQLVLSELTTNAVLHARSPFSVLVRRGPSGVRISVRDASHTRPTLQPDDSTRPSGRGLRIVAAVSVAWGVDLSAAGKTVWAELSPPAAVGTTIPPIN
jgi:anti-sigma regulatory factor (Ser/Thr protein kinase)